MRYGYARVATDGQRHRSGNSVAETRGAQGVPRGANGAKTDQVKMEILSSSGLSLRHRRFMFRRRFRPTAVLKRDIVVEGPKPAMQIFPLFRRVVGELLGCCDHVLQAGTRPLDHGDIERGRGVLPRLGQAEADGGRK
jgi:hypothetical protein